jgi:hypothetical protein
MDRDNNDAGPTGLAGGHGDFAVGFVLAAIAVDPKAVHTRLTQLQKATRAAEEAQKKLASDRVAFAAEMESGKAAAKSEIADGAETNRKTAAWLEEQRQVLDRKRVEVKEIFDEFGIREMEPNIPLGGGGTAGRANPDYMSPIDQIRSLFGKPPKPPVDFLGPMMAAAPPEDPRNHKRTEWWDGQSKMIEPKSPTGPRALDPHFGETELLEYPDGSPR